VPKNWAVGLRWDDGAVTSYRLDRLAVLPLIGLHIVGAGLSTILAFVVWPPLGVLPVLLLLHTVRLVFFAPPVARTDETGVRLGGQYTYKPIRIEWTQVEDVSVERGALMFDRGHGGTIQFPLAYVGSRRDELVKDVYDRLNAANGYRRFDPSV
jgi:hypothetical protein